MKRNIRLSVGLLFIFFTASLLFREHDDLFLTLLTGAIALGLLCREVITACFVLWQGLQMFGKLLVRRVKKVDEMRHCKCCGALAVYVVTTCTPKPSIAGGAPDRKTYFVCRDHHPNPRIGVKAEEFQTHLRTIHPETTFDCIYPQNPY